ncbi:MAG: SpoIID/LytB domain-containing protein, partial [Myxococcaceae bacterium]
MRRVLLLLSFAWVAGACAHGSGAAAPAGVGGAGVQNDAGTPVRDAGVGQRDAGSSAFDGGRLTDPGLGDLPDPDAALDAAATKRLDFRNGDPRVPVKLMEGAKEVTFIPRGRVRMKLSGSVEKSVDAPANSVWRVRITSSTPAEIVARVQLAEFPFADKDGLAQEQKSWEDKGLKVRAHILGGIYGIAGKVIDNRRYLLLIDEALSPEKAQALQAEIVRKYGVRTSLFEETKTPSSGVLELLDENGGVVAVAQDRIRTEVEGEAGFEVKKVEYGVGYDFHGFEDRSYRGQLTLLIDRKGAIAVVNVVSLEDLLRGLVPSEIYAKAHVEALKAQAVTARGEVLAKIGTKHLADPYLLCSEQHCAVYKGRSGEVASANAAVSATRGEALFSKDGRLVDSVYSAVCGGHTENNDVVWGGPPNPSLRGVPDFIGPEKNLPSPKNLEAFLSTELPSACRLSTFAQPNKYRWEKRFTADEVNAFTSKLGIGKVMAMAVTDRGVSGRARLLTISGEEGATQIRGELNIRRLFGMLNSAMFLVTPEKKDGKLVGWLFRGGGWGHGVGMCQTGA